MINEQWEVALAAFVVVVLGFVTWLAGLNIFKFLAYLREELTIVLATASSDAVLPQIMKKLERLGVKKSVVGLVVPTGYSFNLDGSMMYCTFATIFIAQAYNIQLSVIQQITMLLVLMLTSKGMAGVPRASLVVIAATLVTFNLPGAGLLLIIGIDQFLDMGRTATNVIGNSLATAVIGRWEGETAETIGVPAEAQAA